MGLVEAAETGIKRQSGERSEPDIVPSPAVRRLWTEELHRREQRALGPVGVKENYGRQIVPKKGRKRGTTE